MSDGDKESIQQTTVSRGVVEGVIGHHRSAEAHGSESIWVRTLLMVL